MTKVNKSPKMKNYSISDLVSGFGKNYHDAKRAAFDLRGAWFQVGESCGNYVEKCRSIIDGLSEMKAAGCEDKISLPVNGDQYGPIMDVINAWRETQAKPTDRVPEMDARARGKGATDKKLQK